MKVVIQCAGKKSKDARRLSHPSGGEVQFVSRPELAPIAGSGSIHYARPDDLVGPGMVSWRETVVAYNCTRENPQGLSRAAELYSPQVYRDLVNYLGWENVYILSAGWGLIRSDFLTPNYDITFSNQSKVPLWARRAKRLTFPLNDLNQLSESITTADEPIHFFGGRDYLPLFHALMQAAPAKVTVHHKGSQPSCPGFAFEEFSGDQNQNWHYDAAKDFITLCRNVSS